MKYDGCFIHGAAYYPELWDDAVIDNDIEHMKALGINTVRIGEFAWSVFEPCRDEFEFSRFHKIIRKLKSNGISVIMCTPTATPPIWMSYNHPERMYRDSGIEVTHGARQHVCTNNPYFRERSAIIVRKLAAEFGNEEGVIAWQVDNELKCNVAECYCEECEKQWHEWLENKYKRIDSLNEAWGADVWSQAYRSFNQVPTPRRATFAHNPSLSTNYRLFSREKVGEFFSMQAGIIRSLCDKPITHNSALWFQLDNDSMSKKQDFVSFDDYPVADEYRRFVFDCDRFRGLKAGLPFMCMETSPGYNGYIRDYDKVHPVGFLKAEATAVMALGGMGMSYWHFRQHYAGCEMTHGSILTACGKPTVNYRQVAEVSKRISDILEYINTTKLAAAGTAIHYSDTARSFMQTESYDGMDYIFLLMRFHKVLLDRNIRTDIIPADNNVSEYKTVITPFMYCLDDKLIDSMLDFCKNGGTWIVGPMSGIRTAEHTVVKEELITEKLVKALDVKLLHYFPLKNTAAKIGFNGKKDDIDFFALTGEAGKEPVAVCSGQYCDNEALITESGYGKGKVVLLGAMPHTDEMLEAILLHYTEDGKIKSDPGIIAVKRTGKEKNSVFGFDMAGKGGKFTAYAKNCTVEPYGYGIIEE